VWRWLSYGFLHHVVWWKLADVSEMRTVSILVAMIHRKNPDDSNLQVSCSFYGSSADTVVAADNQTAERATSGIGPLSQSSPLDCCSLGCKLELCRNRYIPLLAVLRMISWPVSPSETITAGLQCTRRQEASSCTAPPCPLSITWTF
jgi:hypothetical protein